MTKFKFFCFISLLLSQTTWVLAEDWKGRPDESEFSFGGLTGMGIIDGFAGYALLGTASKKIVSPGFAPDLNNSVSIEGALGPIFLPSSVANTPGGTAWGYSVHLRWDFNKDPMWTFYALGGVGGSIASSPSGGNRFELLPNFGIGSFWKISPLIYIRGEVSNQWIAAGVNVPI